MDNQLDNSSALGSIGDEYERSKIRQEQQFKLRLRQLQMQDELSLLERKKLDVLKEQLLRFSYEELISKLELENTKLEGYLSLFHEEKKLSSLIGQYTKLVFSTLSVIASLGFSLLPLFADISTSAHLFVILGGILIFVASSWVYNSWKDLRKVIGKRDYLKSKLVENEHFAAYVSMIIKEARANVISSKFKDAN